MSARLGLLLISGLLFVSPRVLLRPVLAKPVEQVIQENLATWRFKPGEEVFAHKTPDLVSGVSLAATATGVLYLVWVQGGGQGPPPSVQVVTSPDGQTWTPETSFPLPSWTASLAVAANDLGDVVVAWVVEEGIFAAQKIGDRGWSEPRPVLKNNPTRGSVALAAQPGGRAFELLAVVSLGGLRPEAVMGTYQGDEFGYLTALPEGAKTSRAMLGYRRGSLILADPNQVLSREDLRPVATLPWLCWHTQCWWMAPYPSPLTAALMWTGGPVQMATCMRTSTDLTKWTEPVFVGLTERRHSAVASVGETLYLATNYEPWGRTWGGEPRVSPQREGKAPRVFRLDERLTRDADQDGLTDITEEWLLTDPENPDTDADTLTDAEDPDPLAAVIPPGDEAAIRQAVFSSLGPRERECATLVIAPERQAFAGHTSRLLAVTEAEAEAYRAKNCWAPVPFFTVSPIEIAADGHTATAGWTDYIAELGAEGGTAKLEKKEGKWVVTDKGRQWISLAPLRPRSQRFASPMPPIATEELSPRLLCSRTSPSPHQGVLR